MLKYLLSLSLIVICNNIWAQEAERETTVVLKEKKKIDNTGNPGIAVGIDLAPYIMHLFNNERFGFEANTRYTINRKWALVGELGYENIDLNTDYLEYKSNGSFVRAGFDYNVFQVEELGNNDNIILGIRYAAAIQDHSCPKYVIKEGYWGDAEGSLGSATVGSHWAEFVFGLRSEVLKNFYMGWTVRMKTLISVGTETKLEPYAIPGFGRRDNQTNLGFTYTLEYHIPFKKKK